MNRRPAKRLFTGLAGSPLSVSNPVAESQPEPAASSNVDPSVVRRGRPRKHVDDAAKQAAYRERKQTQHDDAERGGLIAKILRRMRARGTAFACKTQEIREQERRRYRELTKQLLGLPVAELVAYLNTLKQTPDAHGRLHDERSGEGKPIGDLSELAFLDAAATLKESGQRVTPKTRFHAIPEHHRKYRAKLGRAIELALERLYEDGKCGICREAIPAEQVLDHFWQKYEAGYQLVPVEEREDDMLEQQSDPLLHQFCVDRLDNLYTRPEYKHYSIVEDILTEILTEARKTARRKSSDFRNKPDCDAQTQPNV